MANKDLMQKVYDTAFAIKNRIYGNRIVLFAPLYIANYCVNSCTYCAFRSANKNLKVRGCHGSVTTGHQRGLHPGHAHRMSAHTHTGTS